MKRPRSSEAVGNTDDTNYEAGDFRRHRGSYSAEGSGYSSATSDEDGCFSTASASTTNDGMQCFFPCIADGRPSSAGQKNATSAGAAPSSVLSASTIRWSRDSSAQKEEMKPTEADVIMAKEMEQLSLNERETVYEDVHGVSKQIEEEPGFIEQRLADLDYEVSKVRHKADLDRALFMNPTFVRDRDFRLMFLRAERFDATKAAKRMVEHFRYKHQLFSPQLLPRRLRYTDLSQDEQDLFDRGSVQLFPDARDTADRAVYFNLYKFRPEPDIMAMLRVYWYLVMSCMQNDVASQRKGIVLVSYTVGCPISAFYPQMSKQSKHLIIHGLPVRAQSIHFCFEDHKLRGLFSMMLSVGPKSWLVRNRSHFGSHLECQYSLNSFGIPRHVIPVDDKGDLKRDDFMRRRAALLAAEQAALQQEEKRRSADRYDIPRANDVLLGRGMPFQKYPGTVRMMGMVEEAKPNHDKASTRTIKTQICMDIIQAVKDSGGRFLRRDPDDPNWWIEVVDDVAREKVAMGFRNISRKQKEQQQKLQESKKKPKRGSSVRGRKASSAQ